MNQYMTLFNIADTMLEEIYTIQNGPTVVGAWSKDAGTMERRLKVAVVYPSGEVSPIREYSKRKLTRPKAMEDLADLDGIPESEIEEIFVALIEKQQFLNVQTDGSGKCSIFEVYQELNTYVRTYEEPGRVFISDGYGNILCTYLQHVLDKLELGYTRLELQKNFKTWGLLRVNHGTGHVYSYKINTGSSNDWYFSFKLLEESEAA